MCFYCTIAGSQMQALQAMSTVDAPPPQTHYLHVHIRTRCSSHTFQLMYPYEIQAQLPLTLPITPRLLLETNVYFSLRNTRTVCSSKFVYTCGPTRDHFSHAAPTELCSRQPGRARVIVTMCNLHVYFTFHLHKVHQGKLLLQGSHCSLLHTLPLLLLSPHHFPAYSIHSPKPF